LRGIPGGCTQMTDYPRLVFRPEDVCVRDLSVGLRQLRRPELDSHL
jgi:hypothetical protein